MDKRINKRITSNKTKKIEAQKNLNCLITEDYNFFYIVYDLDAWPRNPINNFKFKNCLFEATNIIKIIDVATNITKVCTYSGKGITFDSSDSWAFEIWR